MTIVGLKFSFCGTAGGNRFKLKLSSLKLGSYTASITADNVSGSTPQATTLKFKVTG